MTEYEEKRRIEYCKQYWNNFMKNYNHDNSWTDVIKLERTAFYFWQQERNYNERYNENYQSKDLLDFIKYAKRPYGNKSIIESITYSLGWGYEENFFITQEVFDLAMSIQERLIEDLTKRRKNKMEWYD